MRSAAMVRPGIAKRARPETLRAKSPARSRTSASSRRTPGRCSSRDPAIADGGRRRGAAGDARAAARARRLPRLDDLARLRPAGAAPRSTASRVHKTFAPDAGMPVLRFLHPRLTSMWRALRERRRRHLLPPLGVDAGTGVVAEFCRRHGRRSIYAGASDTDFVPGQQQIRCARDRWLYRRGLRRVDRIVAQNRASARPACEHYGREAHADPELLRAAGRAPRADRSAGRRAACCGWAPCSRASGPSCSSSWRGACRSGAS